MIATALTSLLARAPTAAHPVVRVPLSSYAALLFVVVLAAVLAATLIRHALLLLLLTASAVAVSGVAIVSGAHHLVVGIVNEIAAGGKP